MLILRSSRVGMGPTGGHIKPKNARLPRLFFPFAASLYAHLWPNVWSPIGVT